LATHLARWIESTQRYENAAIRREATICYKFNFMLGFTTTCDIIYDLLYLGIIFNVLVVSNYKLIYMFGFSTTCDIIYDLFYIGTIFSVIVFSKYKFIYMFGFTNTCYIFYDFLGTVLLYLGTVFCVGSLFSKYKFIFMFGPHAACDIIYDLLDLGTDTFERHRRTPPHGCYL